ncbi:fumarylacetoacetate hydrolase family protein [Streptomyces sp. NBC_00878]|uniref:fumarylacetoacetate hydrolase family protein n=1 Tax=Streptomyces sp. NBC_00878 TaxID=2975854 RepID=UPI002256567C|nr:fumarylacetoacetate hydrolase family protein [Streptomyces sp. NBC_00878]MCX4909896.1 fumarylacetoacetate hydrolase family protein [Streptomyces sp. NBC_00878]
MRLVGFLKDGVRHMGAVEGDQVRDLGTAKEFWVEPKAGATAVGGDVVPLSSVTQAPAVPETSRIFCVGINYHSHAGEAKSVAGLDVPKYPMIFARWQQSLVVDGDAVPVPPKEEGLDWEVELAAVIGARVWEAEEATALDHVFGYTAFNDLSARTKQLLTPQFTLGKNSDRSGPIGPVLVTSDEFGDPSGVRVETRVNGEVMQSGNTKDLIHSVGQIIEFITDTLTLLPGDVIATGTPGGVGVGRDPQVFLHPGDVVEVEVERIGVVRNPIVDRGDLV